MALPTTGAAPPLCVDLDGTLVLTDTLHEQALMLIKQNPLAFCAALLALFQGIAAFKREISSRVNLRADSLPYNEPFLEFLRAEAAGGRRILLVTAADRKVAEAVAERLRLFEVTLATDGTTNLKSKAKLAAIQSYLGGSAFEYAGDSAADFAVWRDSSGAVLVNSPAAFRQILDRDGVRIAKEFPRAQTGLKTFLRAIRVYQWSKNVLVFAPLALAHKLFDLRQVLNCMLAFLTISLAASAIYILNDLMDLQADRRHPRKRTRPFAAGTLSVQTGLTIALFLFCCTAITAVFLPRQAQLFVVFYIVLTSLYSAFIKQQLFLDITVLAGLYTLRVLFGGAASATTISPWTAAFSVFIFTSLAICKRVTELRTAGYDSDEIIPGRAYSPRDVPIIAALGCASAYAAVLVLALYVNSPEVIPLYRHPRILWILCPIVAYWISRILIIANRGQMHDDPIVFSFRDNASRLTALASLLTIAAAI
jgi:4-hydroxybenzoate polyprenyltransferase